MTYTPAKIVATAGQRDFTVPFPFISRSHVEVLVNGTQATVLEWTDGTTLRLASTLAGGESVILRRVTPIDDALVQFQNGAILTAEDLNLAVQQTLYKLQETAALYNGALSDAQVRLAQNLGIVTTPSAVADMLAIEVLGSEVLATFQQRIADIDLNAGAILSVALDTSQLNDVVTQASATIDALDTRVTTLNADAVALVDSVDDRVTTLRSDHEQLVGLVDALAGGDPGSGIATLIQDEAQARIDGDNALATTISLIGAKSGDNLSFILDTSKVRVTPTESLAQRLSAISATDSDNAAAIISEQNARVSADNALTTSVNALLVSVGTAEANIVSEQTARVNGDNALSSSLNALTTRVDTNEASIVSEQTARANADSALTTSLNALTSRVGTAEADILSEQTTRANADSAFTSALNALTTRVGNAEASVVTEQTARVNEDNALASLITNLTTRVGTAEANILTEQNTRASADSAFASTLSLLGAVNGFNTAFVVNTATTQIGGGETLATRFNALAASDSNNLALIQSEQTARINGDNALTSSLNSLGAQVSANAAAIVNEQTARADGDSAVASSVTQLAARVTATENGVASNSAAIQNEATVRASSDDSFAQQFALLGAKNGGGTAWVLDQNTVQVGGGVTLGSRLSGIDATLASNAAAIVTEQTARASADSALSSQITTLTSTVNGNTASITSVQSTVNGLNAKYGVSLNVNGHITGFVQNNNGSSGDFTIVADVFRIIAPAGGSPVTPFSVTAEGVRINGNLIVNGSIINDQFNMATMVKKASLSWSGSQTPSPGSTVVISEVALGDIAKEGSLLIEYAVTASAYLGQAFSSFAGKPLTTTYLADGSVRLRVIDGANNVLSEVSLTGSQFGTSGAATYDVGGFGQKVVELTGGAKTGLKLQLVASRGNTDTGNVDEGDYYTRNISGTYTVTASTAKAKWTFI